MSPLASTSQGRTAVAVSVALHGAVIAFLSLEIGFEPAGNTPLVATVVFIAPPDEPEETERAEVPKPSAVPETPPEPQPVTEPQAPTETAPADLTNESLRAADTGEEQSPEAAEAPAEAETAEPVDFEALGRAAVEAYLDREDSKRTFGPPPGEDLRGRDRSASGGQAPSIFDTHTPRRAGLQPNRSKSPLARRVGRLCQELTGGISLFGIIPLCADNYGRRDLFASIRPDYLDEMPECTEVEVPLLAAAGPAMADTSEVTTAIKCRMVPREEAYRD